jgi:hypothetical protein
MALERLIHDAYGEEDFFGLEAISKPVSGLGGKVEAWAEL